MGTSPRMVDVARREVPREGAALVVVESLTLTAKSLCVTWDDGAQTRYPWIWLRDHAHDEATLHPVTQQRQLFTAALPPDITATSAEVVDGTLVIAWTQSERSQLPVTFLREHRTMCAPIEPYTECVLWNAAALLGGTPSIGYDEVMSSDDAVGSWLQLVATYGLCIVHGTPPTAQASEQLLRRIGYIRETIFGAFWEFTADLSKADTAYTNLELRPHTDGTYSADAPGAQMLHCLYFDGTGGESTMVDGFAVARDLATDHPQHYQTLSRVMVPGQYKGDGAHLVAQRPVLSHDHHGQLVQVSFNNYDRAPFLLAEDEMIAFYQALRVFDTMINDRDRQWRHVLAPGEALLFDNWRMLHGREAYTGERRMCGGYINREDMHSKLRVRAPRGL